MDYQNMTSEELFAFAKQKQADEKKWLAEENKQKISEVRAERKAILTRQKQELIDFSDPYYILEYMLISLNEAQIKIKEDLLGEEIGILEIEKNDLSQDYLAEYTIKAFDDVFIMLEELGNKEIEGIMLSLPIWSELLSESEGIYSVLDMVVCNQLAH